MSTYPYGNGYTCYRCGSWVPSGCTHSCPTYITPWPQPHVVWPPSVSTTTTLTQGCLLRVSRGADGFFVTDVVGTRYGHGADLAEALRSWAQQVEDILGMDEASLGDPILSEVKRYREALSHA